MKTKFLCYVIFLVLVLSEKHNSQQLLYPDIPSNAINDLIFVNDSSGYFITCCGSIYATSNGGNTWALQKHYQRNNLTQIEFINETQGFIYSPPSFVGDDISFLYSSEETGNLWNSADINIEDVLTFIPISNSKIIKSDDYGQISMLDNFYEKWDIKYQMPRFISGCLSFPYGEIVQFHNFWNQRILALCNNVHAYNSNLIQDSLSFILESTNEGNSWDTLWIGLEHLMHSFVFVDDSLGWMVGKNSNIYHTSDGGRNWIIQYGDSSSQENYNFNSISAVNTKNIFALNANNEAIISNDGGNSWEKKQLNLTNSINCKIEAKKNGEAFVFGNDLIKTNDDGTSWARVSKSLKVNFYKIDFVSEKLGWGIGSLGILKTIDGGRNWDVQYEKENLYEIRYLDMIDSLEGWAIINGKLLHTKNGGSAWNTTNLTSDLSFMRGVTFLNKDVGVIFECRKLSTDSVFNMVTTNGGITWKEYLIKTKNQPSNYITSFFKMQFTDKDHLWFVNQQGVWLSRDTAKTWDIIDNDISCFSGFDFYDSLTAMVAYKQGTMAFTKDGCKTWEYVDNPYSFQTNDIEIVGQTMQGLLTFACGYDGTMIAYYHEGGKFDFVYNMISYTTSPINDIEVFIKDKRPNIWWAGNGSIIVYRVGEYLITDIKNNYSSSPQMFSLSQNYPNPFNPTTIINYSVAEQSNVTIIIYDALGREVINLVNEEKPAGNYTAEFSAANLSSGIYFYQLRAGDFVQSKKMVLLR
ncbi:MAG: YCF48-related protein [Ignavibacteriaceae bacterium]|jgi:photosystem II stability/assembly factor-like uncharacterized protein